MALDYLVTGVMRILGHMLLPVLAPGFQDALIQEIAESQQHYSYLQGQLQYGLEDYAELQSAYERLLTENKVLRTDQEVSARHITSIKRTLENDHQQAERRLANSQRTADELRETLQQCRQDKLQLEKHIREMKSRSTASEQIISVQVAELFNELRRTQQAKELLEQKQQEWEHREMELEATAGKLRARLVASKVAGEMAVVARVR